MKYKICSYLLQDSRWGPAFLPPQGYTYSEPVEFDIYFQTKAEADKYAVEFLSEKGVPSEEIEYE